MKVLVRLFNLYWAAAVDRDCRVTLLSIFRQPQHVTGHRAILASRCMLFTQRVKPIDDSGRNAKCPDLLFVFFILGACGLIYEVVWTRMLTVIFGGNVFVVSAVLVSFMIGLGIGGLARGRFGDRIENRAVCCWRPMGYWKSRSRLWLCQLRCCFRLWTTFTQQ